MRHEFGSTFAAFGQKPVSFHGSLATHRLAENPVLPKF